MRDKEAVDVERKNLSRNLEKQAKLLERLYENERNLRDQVVGLPEECLQLRSDPALGPPREGRYRAQKGGGRPEAGKSKDAHRGGRGKDAS